MYETLFIGSKHAKVFNSVLKAFKLVARLLKNNSTTGSDIYFFLEFNDLRYFDPMNIILLDKINYSRDDVTDTNTL